MKAISTKFIFLLLSVILGTDIVCSQNSISSERLAYQNLEVNFCDEDRDGYISINVQEMEADVLQTIGIENDYFLEQILISTSNGNIHSVHSPSNDPYISTSCDFNGLFTDIAVNSNQQVFSCGEFIARIDPDCIMDQYNNSIYDINALSFDDLDNLYAGYGSESYVHRFNVDDTSLSNFELWHDFEIGSSGGDFVLLNDKIYVSWKLSVNNYRLYEVTVNSDRDYISHVDLGELPYDTFGLASELGELYGVTPNKLFKINLTDFTFSTIIQNPNPEDLWYGAAGLHEAIVFDTSSYLSLNDAENSLNAIDGNWTNTIPGGQTIYIKIENSYTGEYDIVLLDIIISNDPNVNLPEDVIKCSDNNATVFDLEQVSNQMQINPIDDLVFTYFNVNPEISDASNPLPLQYQSATNPETLFVRVENNDGGCNLVYSFQIISNESPNLVPLSNLQAPRILDICYFDINSIGYFDLNDIKNDIALNDESLELSYYLRSFS
ncbi:hypothetical protein ACFQ3R_11770 [Mesonia ostreae]|uniref:Uncharacterized protein n=1 Tax=Mesonia ostreae TaxID=861110 RepID=A0ABU2KIE2_9FLAO|nr:hypothetical protein [Mesonia ostreae]MDT0294444.1 hypothetical protein [Mesonia ostreae]